MSRWLSLSHAVIASALTVFCFSQQTCTDTDMHEVGIPGTCTEGGVSDREVVAKWEKVVAGGQRHAFSARSIPGPALAHLSGSRGVRRARLRSCEDVVEIRRSTPSLSQVGIDQ